MTSKIDMNWVTGLVTALAGKATSSHTHTIANITSLQTTLDAKADVQTTAAFVTGSRAINTTYQNIGTSNKQVSVTVSPAAAASVSLELSMDDTTWFAVAAHNNTDRRTLVTVVPPTLFYRCRVTSGTATLNSWVEVS